MAASILIFVLLFLISSCKSDDRLTPAKALSYGDVLVSSGGDFALGLFSPAGSNNRSSYLGIWYNNIPVRTVVWVANRDNPITAPASAVLTVTNSSDIVLSESQGGGALWVVKSNATTTGAAAVVLFNTGNLVLQLPNGKKVWQSFDHPTDTVLPGMRFVFSYKDRVVSRIVAWKGPDDPSSGEFSGSGDPASPGLQVVTWRNKTTPYCRVSVWSDLAVSGGTFQNTTNSIIYQTAVDQGEFYFVFVVSDGSPFKRITLDHTGALLVLSWNNQSSSWALINQHPTVPCEVYASCGPFSYCNVNGGVRACQCLDGFEPVGDNSSEGCRRKEALECGGQSRFVASSWMKVPDKFSHMQNRSFDQCADECSRNCSCTAYAYANMTNDGSMADLSRCLLWTGELIDTGNYGSYGQNLYVRLADFPVHKKSNSLKIVLPIIACLLLLTCSALVIWICKGRGKQRKKKTQNRRMVGYLSAHSELQSENLEIPFVGFEDILYATNTFSDSNLLGMGGFGKVYKGILEGGKEVAVKRLSKDSGQGREQFKNEVVLIAKLQHKNLVGLLGCCIHEDEKLLIYEYLPNKSLDVFLFDAARKYVLDWSIRFKIIKGVVRGLLYLHQDSRLMIIHRDLKASNILLDAEMNPKISDFGMARIFGGNQQQANTNRVVGTYGYMSPEYAMEGAFSVKSDTFSLGVLLLEIVSGLKINSPQLPTNSGNLIAYAWRLWEDGNATKLVDSSIAESCPLQEVLRCIHVGFLCVQGSPTDRPLMSSVMFMLENESSPLATPKQPVFFSMRSSEIEETSENTENSTNAMSITAVEGR